MLAISIVRRALILMLILAGHSLAFEGPSVGPKTEDRFPPLVLAEGFQATLFACDPLVEYPSVIAVGPRPGTLFVAHDYMTGLGKEIVRRDEVRLLEDTDGDGYADRSHVIAGGFNSIQGLAYHDGAVYVMHAPRLTALVDTDGKGEYQRRELLDGLGLPPEDNPPRLHCANGVTVGHDGWLYLSLGDHGCNIPRPEGDRLLLQGGGILRCRYNGRDAHVFATGLRNIYDVALDEDLNVFVRDNENDGGTYKIRVCHSFFSADHGYPYLYEHRPHEAMAPLADLGLGSSAGVACYLETAFPRELRGQLFACEWGRAVVRYPLSVKGSGFGSTSEADVAAGAQTDPYGFKPTDVVVDYDGSLLISDWADGQRPKRGRGRIYRIRHMSAEPKSPRRAAPGNVQAMLKQLGSASYYARLQAQDALLDAGEDATLALTQAIRQKTLPVLGRLHAIWTLARSRKADAIELLFEVAARDENPRVAVTAIRAIGDLSDPVIVQGKLAAGRGNTKLAARLAALVKRDNKAQRDTDPRIVREVTITLGRLRWSDTPNWLNEHLGDPDAALAHAASQALRRCGNSAGLLALLDSPRRSLHDVALVAITQQYEPEIVDGLLQRMTSVSSSQRKAAYADTLARVWKRPGPWVYWGYRPPPRPANTVAWSRTAAIESALDRILGESTTAVRTATLQAMVREAIPARPQTLSAWLKKERDEKAVAGILTALATLQGDVRDMLAAIVQDPQHATANRHTALAMFVARTPPKETDAILNLAKSMPDDDLLASALDRLADRRPSSAGDWLTGKLASDHAGVAGRCAPRVGGYKRSCCHAACREAAER